MLALAASAAAPPAAAAAASAQLPPAEREEGEQSILVTGARPTREALRAFVEAVTVETDEQIAKFAVPVCPIAVGLPQGHAEVITTRLRQVAEHVGVGTAREGCEPNVVVVIADSGSDFMRGLRRERASLFARLEASEIREIMELEGPVRAWHLVEARGADGRPVDYIEVGRERRIRPSLSGVMPSLTRTPIRRDMAMSFVVFDVEAIEGFTLLQIADHAAMRALARSAPVSMPAGRSILGLFADRDAGARPAGELAEWDVAYLSALYRTAHDVTAQRQRSSIAGTMSRQLRTPPRQPHP